MSRWSCWLVGLGLIVCTSSAHAQRGDSGAILGHVYDSNGVPIKGVRVTITSVTQIGGRRVAYSDAEGFFRFPALQPGDFELEAEARGLTRFIQKGLRVGINAPVEVNAVMGVQTNVEEVHVVEKPPLVSTSTANIKEVYEIDFVDSLPHGSRDSVYSQFVGNTAGAINGRVRGGNDSQTLYTMDGFNMLGQSPTLRSAAAYEIQTAGYGSDNVTASGGVANIVSRVGSNRFEASVGATAETQQGRFFTDATDSKTPTHFLVLNPSVSGPILKDRLWYSFNLELLSQKTGRDRDVNGFLPEPQAQLKNWYKGTLNLTWQVSNRHKLQSITNFDEVWEFNRRGLGWEKDAQEDRRGQRYFTGLIWQSLLSDDLVFRSQAGVTTVPQHIFPHRCQESPIDCDNIVPVVQRLPVQQNLTNDTQHQRNDDYVFQFINRLEWFVSSKSLGEHNVQVKDNFYLEQLINRTSVPGDKVLQLAGQDNEQLTEYFSNDPRQEAARYGWFITTATSQRNAASIADSWRPTRFLTVSPALAFVNAWVNNSQGDTVLSSGAFAPALAVAWDATHDGRTVLRGSYNNYVDVDITGLAGFTLGSQVSRRCRWNAATQAFDQGCTYSGGRSTNTVGLPCGPSGLNGDGTSCAETLQIPRTTELTAGAERELVQGTSGSIDVVYRRFQHQYEVRETNRIWGGSGQQLDGAGGYRNGRPQTVMDLGTPADARRRYLGITGAVTRREGQVKLRAAYTWSRLDGTLLNGLDGSSLYGLIPPRDRFLDGPLTDDHRHEVHLTLSYEATRWLSFGARYLYYSGLMYNRLFRNDETTSFENLRARTGLNPGTNVNDPGDDRELRLPDVHDMNMQVRVNWLPLIGHRLETFVDVLNVLATRTTTSVAQNDGQDFGTLRTRMAPFRIRLGVMYRY
jgi:Carboxypeptidase regulatory-like domain